MIERKTKIVVLVAVVLIAILGVYGYANTTTGSLNLTSLGVPSIGLNGSTPTSGAGSSNPNSGANSNMGSSSTGNSAVTSQQSGSSQSGSNNNNVITEAKAKEIAQEYLTRGQTTGVISQGLIVGDASLQTKNGKQVYVVQIIYPKSSNPLYGEVWVDVKTGEKVFGSWGNL